MLIRTLARRCSSSSAVNCRRGFGGNSTELGNHDDDDADDLLRRERPPSFAASRRAAFTADTYQYHYQSRPSQ